MLGSNPNQSMFRRSSTGQPQVKQIKDIREAEDFDELPQVFAVRTKDTFHNADSCELCAKKFTFTFRSHHCRMCSKTCCVNCSLERRLSQDDPVAHYTCNECDFDISNSQAK
jgi:hypothetical protein